MEQIFKKIQKANELMGQIHHIKSELLYPIEKVAPGVFEFRSALGGFVLTDIHTERQFNIHHECWFGDQLEVRSFIEVIAEIMGEQDFPVPERDLKDLFTQYNCNEGERELLLSKASDNESYDNWAEEERRTMLD